MVLHSLSTTTGRASGIAAVRAVFMALAMLASSANAADAPFPNRPIRLVLPFPPGGGTDAVARVMAPKLGEILGVPVVVDNRPGAGGNVAAEAVAKAASDGYTLLMGFSSVMTVNKTLYASVPFDPVKDFEPIIQIATAEYFLVVNPELPVKSVEDLVRYAKAHPGKLNYASAGIASPLHLAGELFKSRAGVDIVHVPYKGGGPAALAVITGEAQVLFGSVASSMEQIKAGKLRALAVTGTERSPLAPDLPTLAESGFPDFRVTAWHALFAPAGTPRAVVTRLNEATVEALRSPELAKRIRAVGYEPTATSPQDLGNIVQTESAMWAKLIKSANIRSE
jgi:tripartite-type tricarboxylate transporter receptor subunit TctC